MLTVTKRAAALLKATKAAEGAADDAVIRIRYGIFPDDSGTLAIGISITDDPGPDDEEFEQEGLRIFVEDALVEALEGRILDVRDANLDRNLSGVSSNRGNPCPGRSAKRRRSGLYERQAVQCISTRSGRRVFGRLSMNYRPARPLRPAFERLNEVGPGKRESG